MIERKSMHRYSLVVSGGTFDMFHKGHEEFLKYQLKVSKKIILGITSDEYFKDFPKTHDVQSYKIRKNSLEKFLNNENALDRVKIVPIDIKDPSDLKEDPVEALVVTSQTIKGAELINHKRSKSGLVRLPVLTCPLAVAEDGFPISSTRIRKGEITRNGMLLLNVLWMNTTLYLPPEIRDLLKKPFGQLIKNNIYEFEKLDPSKIVSVGDIATKTLLDRKIIPKISIVDLIVEREKKFTSIRDLGFKNPSSIIKVDNAAGTITQALWSEVKNAVQAKETTIIKVTGEEDLAVLPVILLLPLSWKIFYGQPGEGLVAITIDERIKITAHNILSKFK